MDIKVTKSDVLWSYIAQFFNIASGFLILPIILNLLTTEEIAMNYLMMTISSLVALIDFGFNPQFGRNVTYVFSGAQRLSKEGLDDIETGNINYHLLKGLIQVAKNTYRLMSLIVLVIMLTLGTWYMYTITEGFSNVNNSFTIWLLFSISTFFNIYFYYYSSLLIGKGKVKESNQSLLASKISYIIIASVLLLTGFGLLGVVLSNLISPFFGRALSHYFFYDSELKANLSKVSVIKEEKKELFDVIWYNAKKLGINFIGAYAIQKFAMFIAGLYLSMDDIASYGLMVQVVSILVGISNVCFSSFIPQMNNYKMRGEDDNLMRSFARNQFVFYYLYILGGIFIIFLGPFILNFIKSNAILPVNYILVTYLLVNLLECNHSNFATVITVSNKVPFVSASLIAGGVICLFDFIALGIFNYGMYAIVLIPGIVQLAYSNWYWPRYVLKEYNFSLSEFIYLGVNETVGYIKNYFFKM